MKIQIKEGMKFVLNEDKSVSFTVVKWHYYDDEEIWCAFTDDGVSIYPLSEVILEEYSPVIDGKIINESNEYIF